MLKKLQTLFGSVIYKLFKSPSYGETLEQYIVSRHPKDSTDIERLIIQWQRGNHKEVWI